ncbi:MAG: hypothetical protein ACOYKA_02735 [Legionellaceae bacterium]
MLISALVFFALAAVLGGYLLSLFLRNKTPARWVAMLHGSVALMGLILLGAYSFFYQPAPILSLCLLGGAALGGAFFLYLNLTGKSIPKLFALGHGSVAILGVITLLVFILM